MAADQVSRIQARADQFVMVFDGRHDDLGRIPAVQFASPRRTMGMNGNGDLVFVAELIEAVKTVLAGIGADRLDTERLAIFENLLVGLVILGKVLDSVTNRRNFIVPT